MIAVVQRVAEASVRVMDCDYFESIQHGMCVLLGVEEGDKESHATWMAKKLANLRIFNDDEGKMNRFIIEVEGEILLVSQFTLAGDCDSGNRPSFVKAAEPRIAKPLIELVGHELTQVHNITVKRGVFGAMMQVDIKNDGPVTLILKRD